MEFKFHIVIIQAMKLHHKTYLTWHPAFWRGYHADALKEGE